HLPFRRHFGDLLGPFCELCLPGFVFFPELGRRFVVDRCQRRNRSDELVVAPLSEVTRKLGEGQVPEGSQVPNAGVVERQVSQFQTCQRRKIGNLRAEQCETLERRYLSERRHVCDVRSLQVQEFQRQTRERRNIADRTGRTLQHLERHPLQGRQIADRGV